MVVKIGNIKLKNKLVLAPMAGVCDVAFRMQCKLHGAGLVCTEMISSSALARGNKATVKMLDVIQEERPVSVQLFGQNVENIKKAVKVASKVADIIDLNLGCPAQKVLAQGSGSALLKRPNRIREIIASMRKSTNLPITIKIRSGITAQQINAMEIAKIAQDCGADAIAVHARTQRQGYSGKADWSVIKQVKDAVSIPVMGNGDVTDGPSAKQMLKETGCDLVMIGRAAMGNPAIFEQINHYLKSGKKPIPLMKKDRLEQIHEYLKLCKKYDVDKTQHIKRQVLYFLRGFSGASRLRGEISSMRSLEKIFGTILLEK